MWMDCLLQQSYNSCILFAFSLVCTPCKLWISAWFIQRLSLIFLWEPRLLFITLYEFITFQLLCVKDNLIKKPYWGVKFLLMIWKAFIGRIWQLKTQGKPRSGIKIPQTWPQWNRPYTHILIYIFWVLTPPHEVCRHLHRIYPKNF